MANNKDNFVILKGWDKENNKFKEECLYVGDIVYLARSNSSYGYMYMAKIEDVSKTEVKILILDNNGNKKQGLANDNPFVVKRMEDGKIYLYYDRNLKLISGSLLERNEELYEKEKTRVEICEKTKMLSESVIELIEDKHYNEENKKIIQESMSNVTKLLESIKDNRNLKISEVQLLNDFNRFMNQEKEENIKVIDNEDEIINNKDIYEKDYSFVDIYETNSGLGYNKYAYGIKLKKGFYIIDVSSGVDPYRYNVGDIESYEDTLNLEKTTKYDIKDSPLFSSYLFQELIENIRKLKFDNQILINKEDFLKKEENPKKNNNKRLGK
jgi:hypothetical protein